MNYNQIHRETLPNGYTVTGHGYAKQHHTLTLRAALQWAACYPAATITRHGQFVASKTTH